MTRAEKSTQREEHCREVLAQWAKENSIDLRRFDVGQRWVLFAGLKMVSLLDGIAPLKRVLAYLMAHSGMDLGTKVIGTITGVSDRAVRNTQAQEPEQVLHRVRNPVEGHRQPKLKAEHAGPVAKYLVEHPSSKVKPILAYIKNDLGVELDRLTLRRFFKRYGLGCLRGDVVTDAPLFLAPPTMEAPSC